MNKKNHLVLERSVVLENEVGLHARPAAQFVKTAARYKCNVKVLKDGNEADAKSITSILFLDARRGDRVTIRATGVDAEKAVEALARLIEEFE